jgi:dihydrofolate reductase
VGEIVNSTFVSLDGVINHMEVWHFGYIDDESEQIAREQLQESEALLMGRNTYEAYAASWPQRDGELADIINQMPKYVASTTLDRAEVATLKRKGGDILMHGFGPVANTLVTHGLLDVLHLWVHPHFAGVGGPGDLLLNEGNDTALELIGTRMLRSGVVMLSYRVHPDTPGS